MKTVEEAEVFMKHCHPSRLTENGVEILIKPQPPELKFECDGCCKRFPIGMINEHKCFGQVFWKVMTIVLPVTLLIAITCPWWIQLLEGSK